MKQAPQYSPKEKIRRIGAACVFLVLAVAAIEWAKPVLERWLACRHDGNAIMLYAVFAGYPSFLAAGLLALNGRMFYRVWRQRQYPPQGMKTYRPTPYVYGGKARLRAAGFFLICAFLLGIAAYAAVYVYDFIAAGDVQTSQGLCAIRTEHGI